MLVKFSVLLPAFLLFTSLNIFAQKPFEKQENFLEDVARFMSKPKNAKTTAGYSGVTGAWNAKLSAEQKVLVYSISKKMYGKRYRSDVHFSEFYTCVGNTKLTSDKLNDFLLVSDTTVRELKGNVILNFFRSARVFMESNMLYKYREFNSVAVDGGEFSFRYSRDAPIPVETDDIYDKVMGNVDDNAGIESDDIHGDDIPDHAEEGDDEETGDEGSSDDGWGDEGSSDDGWGDDGWGDEDTSSDDGWGDDSEWDTSDEDDSWGTEGDFGSEEETIEEDNSGPVTFETVEGFEGGYIPEPTAKIPLWGPHIHFDNVTLTIKQYDEFKIQNTSGDLLAATNQFIGDSARVDWSTAGLPADEVYCEFGYYYFDIKKAFLHANEASLTYVGKLDSTIQGEFEYKSLKYAEGKPHRYPRFKSYYADVKVNNFAKNVVYQAGLSLNGTKISGDNFSNAKQSISVSQGDTVKFKAISRQGFALNKQSVTNLKAKLIIYLSDSDSLTHPAMRIRYDIEQGILSARKNKKEFKYSPFVDTYHDMEIAADFVKWDLAQDTFNISIISGRTEIPAIVESTSRFSKTRFDKIQGFYQFHPLLVAYNYATKNRKKSFLSSDLTQVLGYEGKKAVQIGNSMRELAQGGYINYDPITDVVEFTKKGVLYARANTEMLRPKGKVDFDNIFLTSISGAGDNMTYYLESQELKVRGVDTVLLSNTADIQVKIAPKGKEIIIKKNRDMSFDGQIFAKNFIFNGSEFEFSYKDFKVNMPKIDSLQFLADTLLDNSLKDLSGTFQITHPRNKSGLRKMSKYPIFQASDGGKVTFDGESVLGGVYNDSLIQFEVNAFTMDSLSERKPEEMEFAGIFKSSGIFPDFEQAISIMEDKSLGFVHKVPDEGYDLYEGKGKIESGQIRLDKDGLRAGGDKVYRKQVVNSNADDDFFFQREGKKKDSTYLKQEKPTKISYLSAHLESNDFVFYSDSVTALSDARLKQASTNGTIESGVIGTANFPYVDLLHYRLQWIVNADSMLLSTTDTVFKMYEHQATVFRDGTLVLTPNGLDGDGIIETKEAEIKTHLFTFRQHEFLGRHSEYFKIKSHDEEKPALEATDVKFTYSLADRIANIESEKSGEASFQLPYTNYETSLAHATWIIDQKNVAFRMDENEEANQQGFTSTRSDQKGLSFNSAFANYNTETYLLNVGAVPEIRVLDTEIIPDEGSLIIRGGGEMDMLHSAELNVGVYEGFFHLTEGEIKVKSSEEYEGEALYHYINDGEQTFEIKFTEFQKRFLIEEMLSDSVKEMTYVDKIINQDATLSVSPIKEEENFSISEGKQFRGTVTMQAWNPDLEFEGEVRITLGGGAWIPLAENNEIVVGEGEVNGQKIAVGLFFDKKTQEVYAATMSTLHNNGDAVILQGKGTVKIDEEKQLATIMTKERANKESYGGTRFQYSPKRKEVFFEGLLTLLEEDSKFNVLASGIGKGFYDKGQYTIDAMLAIDLETSGTAFKMMSDELEFFLEQYRNADAIAYTVVNDKHTLHKLAPHIGEGSTKKFGNKFEKGVFSINDVMSDKALVISNVLLKWSNKHKAFYSVGKLGISNIFKNEIDAKIKGFIEIPKSDNDKSIHIYMEVGHDRWYYIEKDNKGVKLLSSDEEFNLEVENPKSKDKFKLAEIEDKQRFLSRFKAAYGDHTDSEEAPDLMPK